MRCIGEEIERLDVRLASRVQEETALRLRLGQVLEVLGRGGVFELGFSSLGAYALERCDRSVRWAESARCLARRVEALPELRCPPPEDAELVAFHELEQSVVSGRACQPQPVDAGQAAQRAMTHLVEPISEQRRAWFVMLGSLAAWLDGGLQLSAAGTRAAGVKAAGSGRVSSAGRIALRLRMSRGTYVTPHHLRFRSAGGCDHDHNVGSFCTWCHLYGVHGGRIRATGTAQLIRWEFGPVSCPCLVVHGRERLAA